MGRVLTNNVGLAVVEEPTPFNPNKDGSPGKVAAGHEFLNLEPNTLGTFGATTASTVRNPISASRQRKKGTITDLDSSAEFEHDVIYDVVKRMMRGFMFAKGANELVMDVAATPNGAKGITVPDLTSKLSVGSLIWANGYNAGNGLKHIAAIANNAITTTDNHNLANVGTAKGTISLAGYRTADLGANAWDYTAATNRAVLTLAEAAITALKKVLFSGQLVHIGSIQSLGGEIQNKLSITDLDGVGYARVRSYPSSTTIEFDKISKGLMGDNLVNTVNVDIMFGDFIKPVPATQDMFLEQSYMFELFHPDLNTPLKAGDTTSRPLKDKDSDDAYVYSVGNFCNTMGINLPLTDKATISFAYIGTDTEVPVATKKQGARKDDVNDDMKRTEAMNTVNDIARLRILEGNLDPLGLTTDFKSLTFNINNNASPEKVLRKLGARYMNVGSFDISIEAQCLFTNPLVLTAIRNNETVSMDFILANNDGVLGFDIPGMTLGDGGREYPENESVLVNFTCETFEDDVFKSSFSFSMIPVPLPTSEDI